MRHCVFPVKNCCNLVPNRLCSGGNTCEAELKIAFQGNLTEYELCARRLLLCQLHTWQI